MINLEAGLLACILSLLAGTVEIFSRYRHGFQTVLRTTSGRLYILLNAVLGGVAYGLLVGWPEEGIPAANPLKLGFYAGLGATVVVRARLFTLRVGGKEVAIGPGYAIDKLLSILVREVDQAMDLTNLRLVREMVADVDFAPAVQSARTVIRGMRHSLQPEDRDALIGELDEIEKSGEPLEEKTRALGHSLLESGGVELLREIVDEVRARAAVARMQALPVPAKATSRLDLVRAALTGMSFDETVGRFKTLAGEDESLTSEDCDELLAEVDEIRRRDMPEADKSFALGFLAFDYFGHEAFERHFPSESARRAPSGRPPG